MSVEEQEGLPGGVVDGAVLGLLTLNGALVGVFGPLFNPLYEGSVPLPMGAILTILILPWLVARAAEIDPRRWAAAAPLLAWAATVGLIGFVGPGGDVLLPATWQSLLLCAGKKGERFALPNARVMVHQPSAAFYGQAADIARHAQEIVKLKRRLNEIYAKHTGQTVEAIEKMLDRDTYMTAEEAKSFGLLDQVMARHADGETPA